MSRKLAFIFTFALFAIVYLAQAQAQSPAAVPEDDSRVEFPELLDYEAKVQASLKAEPPVLNLLPLTQADQQALAVALKSPQFTSHTRDAQSKRSNRNEIFAVRPFKAGDLPAENSPCSSDTCHVVEMYNFTQHITSVAIIDNKAANLVAVRHFETFQAEIPEHLRVLATKIAHNSALVKKQLGKVPGAQEFVMAGTKTALNRTRCERAKHICVAPTFVLTDRALWTVVDLEEGRVVGTRFTDIRPEGAQLVFTEQKIQDESITAELCRGSKAVERDGWAFTYHLTSSDGIELQNAKFKGQDRLLSSKNVDWHVSYSDKDGFGYSDAIGCPLFSAAAVVPAKLPKFKELKSADQYLGFELHQDFISKQWPLPCNYYYEQRFQFFKDGTFRVAVASVGRGCGEPGIYRPVIRVVLPGTQHKVYSWDGKAWQPILKEAWFEQNADTKYSPEGYQFKLETGPARGFYIEPARGQFNDKGRGDNAFTYWVRESANRDEGLNDLPTIGPCCNNDFHQGPEKFIEPKPEALTGTRAVLWYVPQLTNSGKPGDEYCWGSTDLVDGQVVKYEFPCIAGPKFIPFGGNPSGE
ncbi:MAG: hypothetical protein K1X79_02890 [Oligoflexia bacterium]|nr:hypothetical protein [Oligoflexia bacterium]